MYNLTGSIGFEQLCAFLVGMLVIYLMFRIMGIFCILLLCAGLVTRCNAQTLVVENFSTNAWSPVSYITFPPGVSVWPETVDMCNVLQYVGLSSISVNLDTLVINENNGGHLVYYYTLGTLNHPGVGTLNYNDEAFIMGGIIQGAYRAAYDSYLVAAQTNAIGASISAVANPINQVNVLVPLAQGMGISVILCTFGWVYRLVRRSGTGMSD